MIVYASVDRFEGNFAVCEVEKIPILQSATDEYGTKPTEMMAIPLDFFSTSMGKIDEGDIIILRLKDCEVCKVYCKDDEEKARRINLLKRILG